MLEWQVGVERWARAGAPALPVHCIPFDAERFTPDYFAAAAIDCPAKIVRAVRKRQAEYFYGRLCARAALLGHGASPGPVGTGPQREPLWPPGFVGSITHSGGAAAAIVLPASEYRGVGIDIEAIAMPDTLDALRSTAVSDEEFAVLRGAGESTIPLLLTAVFSAKESFFKAAFAAVRRHIDFDAIELTQVDMAARTMSFIVRQPLCAGLMSGYRVRVVFSILAHGDVATVYA